VFHLITDNTQYKGILYRLWNYVLISHKVMETDTPMSSSSPLITGYRSILNVAHQYSVKTLTIPLTLASNETNSSSYLKAVEVVFKNTKGVLTELNSSAVSVGGTTLVFRSLSSSSAGFEDLCDRLSQVFRVV
jgi:hypothetical protein